MSQKENIILFDVGANVGTYTVLLNQDFNDNSKIFSFEPSKFTYKILTQNTQQFENVKLYNFGFGDKNASFTLYSNKERSGISSLFKRRLDHFNIDMDIKEDIEIKTIDNFCNDNNIAGIDFLKLDIEGNELKALNGAKAMLENHKVNYIQFEFGGCNIDYRTYFQDFNYLLKDNYHIYRIVNMVYTR